MADAINTNPAIKPAITGNQVASAAAPAVKAAADAPAADFGSGNSPKFPAADSAATPARGQASGLDFRSWGDPHFVSGDGRKWDNMNIGTVSLFRSDKGDLELQSNQQKVEGLGAVGSTVNVGAALRVGENVVRYDAQADKLFVNDKEVAVEAGKPYALPGGGKIERKGDNLEVTSAKGDLVRFEDKGKYMDISGKLSATREDGEVTGALGRFDADTNADNDLVMPDGTMAKSVEEFNNAWNTTQAKDMFKNAAADIVKAAQAEMSPYAKERQALEAEKKALYEQEQAKGKERLDIVGSMPLKDAVADYLRALPAEKVTETDKDLLAKYDAAKSKVAALEAEIATLNEKQAAIDKRLEGLNQMEKLDGVMKTEFAAEQTAGTERVKALEEKIAGAARYNALTASSATNPMAISGADTIWMQGYERIRQRIAALETEIADRNRKQQEAAAEKARIDAATKYPVKPAATTPVNAVAPDGKAA